MNKYLISGILFFVVSLLIQGVIYKFNRKWMVYTGTSAIIGISVVGLIVYDDI